MVMFVQQVLFGITVGSVYALLALGVSIIVRSTGVMNLAQGEFFMFGAFVGLVLSVRRGLPFVLVLPLTLIACGVLGAVVERVAIRPLVKRPASQLIMATIGISMFVKTGANVVWGAEAYRFPTVFGDTPFRVGSLVLVPQNVWILAFSVVFMVALETFFRTARLGKALRATAQDPLMARMLGINTGKMFSITFALSSTLGGAAGLLFAPLAYVVFDMGLRMGVKAFTAAAVGGLGSMPGAIVGGLIVGVAEQLTAVYISSQYRDAIVFAVLLAVLILKPSGVLGSAIRKKV